MLKQLIITPESRHIYSFIMEFKGLNFNIDFSSSKKPYRIYLIQLKNCETDIISHVIDSSPVWCVCCYSKTFHMHHENIKYTCMLNYFLINIHVTLRFQKKKRTHLGTTTCIGNQLEIQKEKVFIQVLLFLLVGLLKSSVSVLSILMPLYSWWAVCDWIKELPEFMWARILRKQSEVLSKNSCAEFEVISAGFMG